MKFFHLTVEQARNFQKRMYLLGTATSLHHFTPPPKRSVRCSNVTKLVFFIKNFLVKNHYTFYTGYITCFVDRMTLLLGFLYIFDFKITVFMQLCCFIFSQTFYSR